MALTDEGNGGIPATMLVSPSNFGGGAYPYPVYQSGNGGNNNGFGQDGWWIVLLIILLAAGGWNNGNNNGGNGGVFGGGVPYIVNNDGNGSVQRGFDQAAVMGGINGIASNVCNGFADVQQSLCNGFAGVNATVSNGFSQAEIANNARQIANMQQAFASQMATQQGFNSLASNFADCCCENRLGIADLKYTVATENCADRQALNEGIRDVITNQTANTQRILDKLCDQELQAERRDNANLRSELMYARGQASQIEQTAAIRAGQNATMTALVNELRSCPIPAQPVYGSQPIFTCPNNNNGCGCGCNGGF